MNTANIPLFDAIAINPSRVTRFFEGNRSEPLAGSENIPLKPAHTNNPRTGRAGFPKEWSMTVERLRVVANRDLPVPFNGAQLFFRVNGLEVFRSTLRELLEESRTLRIAFEIPQMTPFHAELVWPPELDYDFPEGLQETVPSTQLKTAPIVIDTGSFTGQRAQESIDDWDSVTTPVMWLIAEGPRLITII